MNDEVKAIVKEWLGKAEGDFRTADREIGVAEDPNFDAVCFHCQQCIEKLMKAALIVFGENPPKTHDLVLLNELLTPHCPDIDWEEYDLNFLTRAAVEFRYPGDTARAEDAGDAYDICLRLREKLLKFFEESDE